MTSNAPSPRSGDDTFDLIDEALASLAERRRCWLGDDLATITLVVSLIEQAERFLPQLVHDARASGCAGHEIGHALGTSPDDAQLRFDPGTPIADSRWPHEHRSRSPQPSDFSSASAGYRATEPASILQRHAMSWSPAHQAIELEDLPRLRDLLDAGHDIEDDNGDGWTLLRHAIDVEHDGHVQTGEPLHADATAFLLARGADPLRRCNNIPVVEEAESRGHWLAAEIMRSWINRGHQPP